MNVSAAVTPATAGRTADRSLVIRNLCKEYRAGQPVLKNISLDIKGRGMTAIIGPSGTGKSTLIRCINRLVDPTSGEMLGGNIREMKRAPWPSPARKRGQVMSRTCAA